MRPFIKSERWRVVGFSPHATTTGVFGINLSTLFPILGSFEGGAQHDEQGNQTIMRYHSHLAREFYNFKLAKPLVFGIPSSGRYARLGRTKPTPRSKRHKSLGTRNLSNSDQLSPYHDSQF